MNIAQVQRYARHIALPEVGPDGQERLLTATVVLVDDGGPAGLLVETAGRYLIAAGVGTVRVLVPSISDSPVATRLQAAAPSMEPHPRITTAPRPDTAAAWAAALADAAVVVRGGFAEDALLDTAIALGVDVVIGRPAHARDAAGAQVDLLAFRNPRVTIASNDLGTHGLAALEATAIEARIHPAPQPRSDDTTLSIAAVVAGTLVASETLWAVWSRADGDRDPKPEDLAGLTAGQPLSRPGARHLRLDLATGSTQVTPIPWPPTQPGMPGLLGGRPTPRIPS